MKRRGASWKSPRPGRWLGCAAILVLALLAPPCSAVAAVKGLYVGDEFYAPGASTQSAARSSGFTRLFLSFFHIDANGNVDYNHTRVAENGVYVGDPAWREKLAGLKEPPGGIHRLELVLGGRGDASFSNISTLLSAQGTGTNSILYRDLVVLQAATGAEAIQCANEATDDVAAVVAFGQMCARVGFKVTLAPSSSRRFWTSVRSQLGSAVDAVYLQCYNAGAENEPGPWVDAFGGVPVYPGLWGNTDTPASVTTRMREWQRTLGITGGFMWLNGFMPGDAAKWAGALACGLDPLASVRIVNKNSGKSLDLRGTTNGAAIVQRDFAPGDAQRWLVAPAGQHFKLVSWLSGQCASIAFDSTMAGAVLWNWDYNSDPSQQFDLVDAGNGWFKLRNLRSGLVLEMEGGSLANQAMVRQNLDVGAAHQLWRFYPYGDDVLACEHFNYPAGPLGGQNGGEGWSGAWQNDLGSTASVRPWLPPPGRPSENTAYVGTDQRVGRYLDCSRSGPFGAHGYLDANGRLGAPGTTLYLSFLQQPAHRSLFYEFELNRGALRIAGIGNDTHTTDVLFRTPAGTFISLGPGDTNVNRYVLRMDFKGGHDEVRVYRNPDTDTEPASATLTALDAGDMSFDRISLAAFANSNSVRHSRIRLATSWQDVLKEGSGYRLRPAHSLGDDDLFRRVTLAAQVLHGEGQTYFLQAGIAALRAHFSQAAHFAPGESIEVTGLVARLGPPIVLIEATARSTGVSALPRPEPMPVPSAQWDSRWVSVVGTLVELKPNETGATLQLQVGSKKLAAKLPSKPGAATPWALGSRLQLCGVLLAPGDHAGPGQESPGFELLLNSAADVDLLARPPWWTLKRLLIAVGVLATGLALAFIWITLLRRQVEQRTRQWQRELERRKHMEQERIIAEERTRISRDLHDDLGSQLTQISLLAYPAPGLKLTPEAASDRLRSISTKARAMVSALDEVVWMMNPKAEPLSSFAAYVAAYTEEFLARTEVTCRIETPEAYPARVIPAEVRNHLFSAVKEALSNAVRHGQPGQVWLKVAVGADQLEIQLRDNGCGFEAAAPSPGHGLANLRERMRKVGGSCRIASTPGAGTTTSLSVPLSSTAGDEAQGLEAASE